MPVVDAPRPGVAEPQGRQYVQRRGVGAAVGAVDDDADVLGARLRVRQLDVEVPVVVEDAGVDEFVLGLVDTAASVLRDEVGVRKGALRVLVEPPHPRVRRGGVERPPVLLDVLAVVALRVREAEQPLFQDRVVAVPQREREAEVQPSVADPAEPVLAPPVGRVSERGRGGSSPRRCRPRCSPRAPFPTASPGGTGPTTSNATRRRGPRRVVVVLRRRARLAQCASGQADGGVPGLDGGSRVLPAEHRQRRRRQGEVAAELGARGRASVRPAPAGSARGRRPSTSPSTERTRSITRSARAATSATVSPFGTPSRHRNQPGSPDDRICGVVRPS